MFKISLTFIFFFALSVALQAQSDVSKSRYKSQEILIDGNDRDWKKPLNFYDDKTGLLFAISNDNRNLFLAFTLNDEMKMRKLMNSGWSVTLSTKEKKRKFSATLVFPGVKMVVPANKRAGDFEKKAPGNPLMKEYQSKIQTIVTKGFRSNQSEIHVHDPNGIDIAVGASKEEHIFYEIAVPLTELMPANFIRLDELMTLAVTVNAMDRPSSGGGQGGGRSGGGMSGGGMSEMGGGRSGGGMGGSMGGGRSGGGMGSMGGGMSRGGGGSGDRGSLFEKTSFKQKFTLSSN